VVSAESHTLTVAHKDWPIIVGGCYRSRTSLVRRLLNAHSRIHCGPEVKFFRDFAGDYLEDPIRHLRFMQSARAILPQAELLKVLGKAFVALHQRAAELACKPRWADKNPENVYGELVARPDAVLPALMEWMGESFEPNQLQFGAAPHQSGLEDPKIAQSDAIHAESVGSWRETLTPREAARVVQACAALWKQIDPAERYCSLAS